METITRVGTPLRQRMIEDMRMRKLEPKTQDAYVRAVRKPTVFLQRSPDTATFEDLRNFQLHLVDTGTSPITLNATLSGLKFFFDTTLGRGELMARMQPVKMPRTVPVVLSVQEAAALIAAARDIKHQAALSVAYGSGLRASEVCRLKVGDVDSQRMALRVEQGKGAKDRYAMLSPVVLQRLAEPVHDRVFVFGDVGVARCHGRGRWLQGRKAAGRTASACASQRARTNGCLGGCPLWGAGRRRPLFVACRGWHLNCGIGGPRRCPVECLWSRPHAGLCRLSFGRGQRTRHHHPCRGQPVLGGRALGRKKPARRSLVQGAVHRRPEGARQAPPA